jgi:ceramide glucosyltransferase
MVEPFRYAFGASIAFRREVLERIGGFASLADYLADDYLLGNKVARAGSRLVLLPYIVETVLDSATLGDVWRHLLRWSRTYRAQRPVSWFFTVLTHATLWGTIAPVVTGGSAAGWAAFVGAVGARLVSLAGILRLLGDSETPHHLWLVPLKDLGSSLMWAAAFLGRRVNWSGRVLRVMRDGRMVQVSPATAPAPVEAEDLRAAGS